MRHALMLLPLLLAAGCETHSRPYSPVETVRYQALGQDPFWMVTIGDDSIVLSSGREPEMGDGRIRGYRYPRTLPRIVDGVRRWESADGTAVISVEAFPEPCDGAGGRRYRDRVRVRLSGREMHGCGGPEIDGRG